MAGISIIVLRHELFRYACVGASGGSKSVSADSESVSVPPEISAASVEELCKQLSFPAIPGDDGHGEQVARYDSSSGVLEVTVLSAGEPGASPIPTAVMRIELARIDPDTVAISPMSSTALRVNSLPGSQAIDLIGYSPKGEALPAQPKHWIDIDVAGAESASPAIMLLRELAGGGE